MAGDWFYVPNDRATELGPFSQEQLQDLLASGEIGPDTMIRKRSWMDWQKAGTIDLLTTAPKPPDSAYPEQGHAGNTDPVVVPNSRRKPRRTILVVVSVVAAVLVVAVAVEVRTGGNGPPANESAQSFAPQAAAAHQTGKVSRNGFSAPAEGTVAMPQTAAMPTGSQSTNESRLNMTAVAAVDRDPVSWFDDPIVDTNASPAAAAIERGNEAWCMKRNMDLAISEYTEAIRLDPKNAVAYNNRGLAYRIAGKWDKAIADFTENIRLEPKCAAAYYNRGRTYRDKGENDKAIADYSEAIRLDSKLAIAHYNRGNAYAHKGDIDKAKADFEQAKRLDRPPPSEANPVVEAPKPLNPIELYAQSKAAVATIHTKDDSGFAIGLGSGFFINLSLVGSRYRNYDWRAECTQRVAQRKDSLQYAYLLTNHHVIESAATAKVDLSDGRSGAVDDVVMEDERRDLAVVCVYLASPDPVKTLPIAMRNMPAIGEQVYSIGSPQGLDATLSNGLITGIREIEPGVSRIQTNAAISPGSSGGPLLDSSGAVIGVVVASHKRGQNLNLAIPAADVIAFLKGPVNTRELWRGSGIDEEEDDAYSSARIASWALKRKGKASGEFLEMLSNGKEKRDNEAYGRALESLARTPAGQMGDWQYLLHFTIGRFAAARAQESEMAASSRLAYELRVPKKLQSIARSNLDEQQAEECFAKAIQLKPEFSPSYLYLAESLQRQGRIVEAIKGAEQLLRRVPRCPTAYRLRGNCYADLDRNLDALTDYRRAVELGPSDRETYLDMAYAYRSLGQDSEAIEAFDATIRLSPPNSRDDLIVHGTYIMMGLLYDKMGKVEQANACFEKARSSYRASEAR